MSVSGTDERRAVWLITAIAAVSRLAALAQPMRYDESVTWAYFVGKPWHVVVSSYQFPNNHVFFSLLAKVTSSLAPFQPWALRLPAFLAGVAIVPLTWAVGRRFASPRVGLLGAALTAVSTPLILYSTNARGYSLVVALFLVMLLLASDVLATGRIRCWVALAVVGALGLYTVPVMLYPLGIVAVWLILGARGAQGDAALRLIGGAILSSAVAGAIALGLYLPIIRTAGLGALTGNRFVEPSTWREFFGALPAHGVDTLLTWTDPLPWPAALVVGVVAMLGVRRKAPSERASLAAAAASWCGVLLLVTHRVPFVRVWLFLLPLFLLAVARGAMRIAERLSPRRPVPAITPIAVAVLLGAYAVIARPAEASNDTGAFRPASRVTSRLTAELRPGDRVLAPIPTNGPLLYYFSAQGLDTALLNTPPPLTRRVFLVLDPARGRTVEWAVQVGMIDPRQFLQPERLLQEPEVELWRSVRR